MIECLIIGDQYAMDVATLNDKCFVAYTANINTEEFSSRFKKFPKANKTIISLGSFDSYVTIKSLDEYRARFGRGSNIIWVLPSKDNPNRDHVYNLAAQYDDLVTEKANPKDVEKIKEKFKAQKPSQPQADYFEERAEAFSIWPLSLNYSIIPENDNQIIEESMIDDSTKYSHVTIWPPTSLKH